MAIELSLLGAQVVLLEKRETFSRNNVLHLWPYTIYDLRELGAKKFYGKFCSGSLDHISESLRQLLERACMWQNSYSGSKEPILLLLSLIMQFSWCSHGTGDL